MSERPNPEPAAPASPEPSWREEADHAARSAVDHVAEFGKKAADALVLDDWKALTDANSTPLQRLGGAADLAMWFVPEGKVVEVAGHALASVAEHLAAHGVEATAEHALESGVERAATAAVETAPVKEPYVPHWNTSDIWQRPLSEGERRGEFNTADDIKALLGPAGKDKDWHHIVESNTEERFGADRVQNVANLVAIDRDPIHRDISREMQRRDVSFGTGPDGKFQSQRSFMEDQPWEMHVDNGERQLRAAGLDPTELRAQTRERFDQRVELHDRLRGQAIEGAAEAPSPPNLAIDGNARPEPSVGASETKFAAIAQPMMRFAERLGYPDAASVGRDDTGRTTAPEDAARTIGSLVDRGLGVDGVPNSARDPLLLEAFAQGEFTTDLSRENPAERWAESFRLWAGVPGAADPAEAANVRDWAEALAPVTMSYLDNLAKSLDVALERDPGALQLGANFDPADVLTRTIASTLTGIDPRDLVDRDLNWARDVVSALRQDVGPQIAAPAGPEDRQPAAPQQRRSELPVLDPGVGGFATHAQLEAMPLGTSLEFTVIGQDQGGARVFGLDGARLIDAPATLFGEPPDAGARFVYDGNDGVRAAAPGAEVGLER